MENNIKSPIAIGGMGGSGTRIVAKILVESGVFIGCNLNHAYDNLVFTRLFKDPDWFRVASSESIYRRLNIFEKYMTGEALSWNELKTTFKAFKKNTKIKTNKFYYGNFLLKHVKKNKSLNKPWGWKEPNTQIYIKYLIKYFSNLKYIHVIRNGLDMAFSENQQQLINWGFLFDINFSDNKRSVYYHQLNYWIKSNKAIIEIAKNSLGSQIYILNFDQLCLNATIELPKLMSFIGLEINEKVRSNLIELIKPPKSMGRAKEYDLSIFTTEQIKEVKKLDYDLKEFSY